MKVLVGTKNAGKIEGARRALSKYFDDFEIEGVKVDSDVADQPVNGDIIKGAQNRVNNLIKYAKENNIQADLYMAIESGINNFYDKWFITNVAAIEDNKGYKSNGIGASFPVPEKIAKEVISSDLNTTMNKIFGEDDERHTKAGGIQLLTHNAITRIDITEQAFVMALINHTNGDKWK